MKTQELIDEIKLELTGYVLEMEIDDATIMAVISKALRELERYWDETTMITVPFASCIDTSGEWFEEQVSSIVNIYRTEGLGVSTDDVSVMTDPVYAQQWLVFNSAGGNTYNLSDYVQNYCAWMTTMQLKNTMATDLTFKEDRHNHKLYISQSMTQPAYITIEYIPKLAKVDDIKSDYWIDILVRLCVALTKVVLGRIRTRFTQGNALWTQDGDKLLEEGNTDLKELRELLRANSNLIYPMD